MRRREGNFAYPDVVFVFAEPQFADGEFDTLLNPVIVIEILSKSTRFRDKTEKLETYQKMESIQECLIIKQTPKQWLLRIYEGLDGRNNKTRINRS